MANRDDYIIQRIIQYGSEITKAHQFFQDDQQLFIDQDNGAIYRNAVTMPLLQIGELSKLLSNEFITSHNDIPWKNIIRLRYFEEKSYIDIAQELGISIGTVKARLYRSRELLVATFKNCKVHKDRI